MSRSFEPFYEKRTIKILQLLSQAVGLAVPNLYSYSGLAVFYIIYSFLICIGLISLCGYSFYFGEVTVTAVVTMGGTVTNVASIVCAVIFRRRKIVQIAKSLKDVEIMLNNRFDVTHEFEERKLFTEFVFLEALILLNMCFDMVIKIREGSFSYGWFIIVHLNTLLLSLTVTQVKVFSGIIKQYLTFINNRLRETTGAFKMRFFTKIYDRLCDLIDLTNKSYGIQLTLLIFVMHMHLIHTMNLLMEFILNGDLLADVWKLVIYMFLGVTMIVSCEEISNEINNTVLICYKILLDFPSPNSNHHPVMKSELVLLAERLGVIKVKFSAAGLFRIDRSLLNISLGLSAAYFLLVLQLK